MKHPGTKDTLPAWLGLAARRLGQGQKLWAADYGAASLPGEFRFLIMQVKFPLPSKSFFNCSGGSFVSFRSQALPCKEANPAHILLSIPSLFAGSKLCVIFWNYPVYLVFVFVICLLHWPCQCGEGRGPSCLVHCCPPALRTLSV